MSNNPEALIIHHTGVSYSSLKRQFYAVNQYHRKKFGMKSSLGYWVAYHYFIESDGTLYQARRDREDAAHTIGWNSRSIAFCLAGNFNIELPTPGQLATLKRMIKGKMSGYKVPLNKIGPHRKFQPHRSCFGTMLPDDWIQRLLNPTMVDKEDEAKQLALIREKISLARRMIEAIKVKMSSKPLGAMSNENIAAFVSRLQNRHIAHENAIKDYVKKNDEDKRAILNTVKLQSGRIYNLELGLRDQKVFNQTVIKEHKEKVPKLEAPAKSRLDKLLDWIKK